MAEINADHKLEMGNYFEEGIHKVKIAAINLGKTQGEEKEFMEFDVLGENGEEASARIWFTTDKAIRYSFNVVKSIFLHNCSTEEKKEKMRKLLDGVTSTEQLAKVAQEALIGKEAFYSTFKSATRTYVDADGETKASYDRNITGWEPQVKKITPPETIEPVTETGPDGQEVPFADGF